MAARAPETRARRTTVLVSVGTRGFEVVRRQQGVGKVLVETARHKATELGCMVIEVTSSFRRSDAHAFCLALGFEESSRKFVKRLRTGVRS